MAMTEETSESAVAGWREVTASASAEAGSQPLATLASALFGRFFCHNDGSTAAVIRIGNLEGQQARTTLDLAGEKDPKAALLLVSAGAGPDAINGAVDRCTGDAELGRYPLYLALPDAEAPPMTVAVRARLVVPEPVGTLDITAAWDVKEAGDITTAGDVKATGGENRWNLYRVKMEERLALDLRRELLSRGVGPGPIEGPDNLRGREKWFQRRSGQNEE